MYVKLPDGRKVDTLSGDYYDVYEDALNSGKNTFEAEKIVRQWIPDGWYFVQFLATMRALDGYGIFSVWNEVSGDEKLIDTSKKFILCFKRDAREYMDKKFLMHLKLTNNGILGIRQIGATGPRYPAFDILEEIEISSENRTQQ